MRKLRKFVTLSDYYTSNHIEGVVNPRPLPLSFRVVGGGEGSPLLGGE